MTHNSHVRDGLNMDATPYSSLEAARDHYLWMTEGWKPYHPFPVLLKHDGVWVVRDDKIVGTKARAADFLLSNYPMFDTVVYCQPRVGLAGLAMIDAAKHYGMKVVLFMPASKRVSLHQACCIERGATPVFVRVAAMQNLARAAIRWSLAHNALFLPLGLRHPLATAAIVRIASGIIPPRETYVAISTGVLARALQIAWPRTEMTCVAVARNLKAGELGRASVISEPLPFAREEDKKNLPPFRSVNSYDAKVWKYVPKDRENVLFWNVGQEPVLNDPSVIDATDSYREWVNASDTDSTVHSNLEKFGWT